ncbi:hypothetical protein [Pseudomonas sp. dw_358]|uniref:hypothetical protein n=1 Tax=Pseudomonas sp. dw_358 TaxID=2720083 RepID=UPI001BD6C1A9|nr:hypothetical protein [Pseudomonas sp. dw_358]
MSAFTYAITDLGHEVLIPTQATLSIRDVADMNHARAEFDKLERLLLDVIIPTLGAEGAAAAELRNRLEQVNVFSGNFCSRFRHMTAGGVQ